LDQTLEYLKMTYGPGAVVIGIFIARGLWKLAPIILNMIVEMRLLRAGLDEVKKYGARIEKLELDVDEAHKRIREITKENSNGMD
jgi:hypothetical protein